MNINYTYEQKWPDSSWERSARGFSSLKVLRKSLKQIQEWDKFEKRRVNYRIVKITENIIK